MSSVFIFGGHVIDPAAKIDGLRDVLLHDGLVAAIANPGTITPPDESERIDAKGCIVAPGFVDIHVHLREPGQTYKETIATGTAAAAAGGFTTVVAMPNTVPVNDSVATLQWMLDPARVPASFFAKTARLFAMPAVTLGSLGTALTDMEALAAAGAVGFTDDGKPVLADHIMREALLRAGRLGLVVSQHAEDTRMSNSSGIHAGSIAFRLGLRGMTVEAESSVVERDIALVRDIARTDGIRPHLHVQHVSTARPIAAIRAAKAAGLHVTCEAAPHHFTLTHQAIGDFDTNAKMNPPLREESDRLALIAGLRDGTVDCIATDHAPHARHEKEVEFAAAPNGITGLETALGLALRVLHRDHGISLARIVEVMSTSPARIAGLKHAGTLAPGAWADCTIFDPHKIWQYNAATTHSKSRNTPFDGAEMQGRVKATIVAGKVVFSA